MGRGHGEVTLAKVASVRRFVNKEGFQLSTAAANKLCRYLERHMKAVLRVAKQKDLLRINENHINEIMDELYGE